MALRTQSRRRTPTSAGAFGLLAALLLTAAGCGGNATAPPPSSSATPAAAVATPLPSPAAASPAPASPQAVGSAPPVASATPVAGPPEPVCANRPAPAWVTGAKNPEDGDPGLVGRIYFGQDARMDDILGQIVAPLFAVDPDGSDLVQVLDCEIERPRVSPEGSRLAFSIVMSDGTWQVATSAVDGSDLRILTSTAG